MGTWTALKPSRIRSKAETLFGGFLSLLLSTLPWSVWDFPHTWIYPCPSPPVIVALKQVGQSKCWYLWPSKNSRIKGSARISPKYSGKNSKRHYKEKIHQRIHTRYFFMDGKTNIVAELCACITMMHEKVTFILAENWRSTSSWDRNIFWMLWLAPLRSA